MTRSTHVPLCVAVAVVRVFSRSRVVCRSVASTVWPTNHSGEATGIVYSHQMYVEHEENK